MSVKHYIHECRGRDNTPHEEQVLPYEVRDGDVCAECGEPLATPAQIAAYLYEQLLDD